MFFSGADFFGSFYSQPWVKTFTIPCILFLLVIVPIIYMTMSRSFPERLRVQFNDYCWEIYNVLFLTCIPVVIYWIISLLNSNVSFVDGDALPWISLISGFSVLYDFLKPLQCCICL